MLRRRQEETKQISLGSAVPLLPSEISSAENGQLNPEFVERMMGYPHRYTDIEKDYLSMTNEFPAAWLDDTWKDSVSPLTLEKKNRKNRLMCLGNTVLPQITECLWRLIICATGSSKL